MIVLSIIVSIIVIGFSINALAKYYSNKAWKDEMSDWLVGDEVYLKSSDNPYTLNGWSHTHIFVSKTNETTTTKYDREKLDFNKSVIWRRNYDECKAVMNADPTFKRGLSSDSNTTNGTIDNKPVELLSEIECQVYLKQALDTEDYGLAAQIREQLKKYR
jgi:hypothetical protein